MMDMSKWLFPEAMLLQEIASSGGAIKNSPSGVGAKSYCMTKKFSLELLIQR